MNMMNKMDDIQNQDLDLLQNILDHIDSDQTNIISDSVWCFKNLTLNFDSVLAIRKTYPSWNENIDLVWLVKILLLKSIEGVSSHILIRYRFDSILKTLWFLSSNNKNFVDRGDLQNYYTFLLMTVIHDGRIEKKLKPFCYHNFQAKIPIETWVNSLKFFNISPIGFKGIISEVNETKALKNTIETICKGDLTYRDWIEGGSLDRLTLDFGKYYVDHCVTLFDQNIGLALALKKTLGEASLIAKKAGMKVNEKNLRTYVMMVISSFLSGKKRNELSKRTIERCSPKLLRAIEKSTASKFKKNMQEILALQKLVSEIEVGRFSRRIGLLTPNKDQLEGLKYLIQARWAFLTFKQKKIISLRNSETTFIAESILNGLDLDKLNALIDESYKVFTNECNVMLPEISFFKNLGLKEKSTQSTYVYNFLRYIEAAGAIKFVALTGWRESEFGFSLQDVIVERNLDILDKSCYPIRFFIKWVVPKTSGESKLNREVTRGAYETVLNLAQLTGSNDTSPCLYTYNTIKTDPAYSSEFIKRIVGKLWVHFTEKYKPFIQLKLFDELHSLKSKQDLNKTELARHSYLEKLSNLENWEQLTRDPLLKVAYHRVNDEVDRVEFFLNQDLRRGFLWEYKLGTLKPKSKIILDTYLPKETKKLILKLISKKELSPVLTKEIMNELISGCLYPTPHAFRHMWAEAVYRRFDGDAGWMIRSNFKHVNQTMWLAYIRSKDNRRQHDKIKRQVVSSLFNNFILNKGVGYAGATEAYLKRLLLNTKVVNIDELITQIEDEIEGVKSSPWGYCILRKRSRAKAQCAQAGEPQRQNASPSFCLGCTHNLTQVGNIEGILLGISNDLKVIQNPQVPYSYHFASFNTVQNAIKHLKKLQADKEVVLEIENILHLSEADS